MNNVFACLRDLFAELVGGPPAHEAYMLNPGDAGLLRSLDGLSAAAASVTPPAGGASIAAHADHLRSGLSLMNRWAGGEADPWAGADWARSWRQATVSEGEWASLRAELRAEATRWREALGALGSRELSETDLKNAAGSIAHLAYHLGAIRQIDRTVQGPKQT
jgi:hypothetical protein